MASSEPSAGRGLLREFTPRKSTWFGLLSSPTSYLMLVALAATLGAKLVAAGRLEEGLPPLALLGSLATDIGLYALVGALLAAAESRGRSTWALTMPVAGVLTLFALANALFLVEAGEQGTWGAVKDFFKRFDDVQMVLGEEAADPKRLVPFVGYLLILVSLPLVSRRLFRRLEGPESPRAMARRRCGAMTSLGVVAALVAVASPAPPSVEGRGLARNAALVTARGMVFRGIERGGFEGFSSEPLIGVDELAAGIEKGTPNVVVIVLESTRWDYTSLAGEAAKAETPHLAELAARGTEIRRTRAVLPHTTKSLFTALCGQLPTLQRGVVEVDARHEVDCLADVFRRAGYRTAFFQSAFGTFEDRPRLVNQFGYEEFGAWEDLRGQKLGYLASDDATLGRAFKEVIKGEEDPFFVTLLTSATHHPYRIPKSAREPAGSPDPAKFAARHRYAVLVNAADRMLGHVVRELERSGHADDTLIVVFGDHGEGFGDHGVRQHDNNYFEEGLRVPWVMAGAGVEQGRVVETPASLLDMTPTILGRLGWEARTDLGGADVVALEPGRERELLFACYAARRCRGFVGGQRKIVEIPENGDQFAFDLGADPDERNPLVPTPEEAEALVRVRQQVMRHRTPDWMVRVGELTGYGLWRCFMGDVCRHPRAFKAKHRLEAFPQGTSP